MPRRYRGSSSSGKVTYNPFSHHSSNKDWSEMNIDEKEFYLHEEEEYMKKLALERQANSKKQITKIIVFSSLALIVIAIIVIIVVVSLHSSGK